MNLFPGMDNSQPFEYFPNDISNDSLINIFLKMPDKPIESSIVHILNEHEQSFLEIVCEMILYDVLRLTQGHNCYLLFDFILKFFILNR